jgi:hypothetical protein
VRIRTARRVGASLLGVVVAAGALSIAAPAQAATLGTLALTPTAGGAFTALTVTASSGCPATATHFKISISGGSIGATPQNINGVSDLSSIPATPGQTTPMTVPLSKVLDQVRSDAGLVTLASGTYTLDLLCRKKLQSDSLGDFVGTFQVTKAMTASSDGAYVANTPGAPTNTKRPTISGTAKVGAKLTCSKGTWGGSPTSFGYRWLRNGVSIAGAIKTTYSATAKDYKKLLSCKVTAKNSKGSTAATSLSKKVALGASLKVSVKPSVKGTPKVGKTLSISHGTWKPSAKSYSYSWKSGTKVVAKGAKATHYKLKASDKGKKITVTVTASATGYATGHATTKSVKVK